MVVLKNLSKLLFPASHFLLGNVGIELKNCANNDETPHEYPDDCGNATKQKQHRNMMDKACIKARGYIEYFRKVNGVPGMSCAVLINGEVGVDNHMINFGYPDIYETKEVHNSTLWDIRGIAGAFVSYLYMRYIQNQQELGDDSNSREHYGRISRLLMQNLTDIRSNGDSPFPPNKDSNDLITDYVLMDVKKSAYNYSLQNFHYLSNALEQHAPEIASYKDSLKKLLSETGLGMKLYEELNPDEINDVAKGHHYRNEFCLEAVNQTHKDTAYGACGVLSTSLNLARMGKLFWENYKTSCGGKKLTPTSEALLHGPLKAMFEGCSDVKVRTIKDGRLRLGFLPCLAFNKVEDLQPYGMRDENLRNFFISSNVSGYSSILYIKGVDGDKNYIVVAITCNKEKVQLYGLADRVATMYEEANKIYDKTSPFVEAAAQL